MKTKKPGFYISELLKSLVNQVDSMPSRTNAFHLSTWLPSVSDVILLLRVKGYSSFRVTPSRVP